MSLERESANIDVELARLTEAVRPLDTDELAARIRERLEAGAAPKFLRPGMRPRKAVWVGVGGAVVLAIVGVSWLDRTSRGEAPSSAESALRSVNESAPKGAGEGARAPALRGGLEPDESQVRENAGPPQGGEGKTSRAATANPSSLANVRVENLLYEAARSLRGKGDAREALRLLDELARRSSGSASSEEVLALRIEASGKLGSVKTKAYAERYLSLYPSGKYRRLAESALGASSK